MVGVLVERDSSEVLTELLLLKVLLGQVLKVSLGEGDGSGDNKGEGVGGDGDGLTHVSFLALNLDVVGHVLGEILEDKVVITDGELTVDLEFVVRLLALLLVLDDLAHLFFV